MKLISIIIILWMSSSAIESAILKCDFYYLHFINESSYACRVKNIEIFENSRLKIDAVIGNHTDGNTNDDVLEFSTSPWAKFKFFPENLGKFFRSITRIETAFAKLEEIHQNILKNFPKLKYLNLEHNQIRVIEADLFKFNPDLEEINLGNNRISYIHPKVFSHLDKLKELRLNDNKCEKKFGQAFGEEDVRKLVRQIERGNCTKYTPGQNEEQSSLNTTALHCVYNYDQFTETYSCNVLDNDIFVNSEVTKIGSVIGEQLGGRTNEHVTKLDFTKIANINYVPKSLEKFFKNLLSLRIKSSNLKEIHQDDLKNYPNLVYLNLAYNEIKELETNLFEFNTKLMVIFLENNEIAHIDPKIFRHLDELSTLALYGNKCGEENFYADERSSVVDLVKRIEDGKCLRDFNNSTATKTENQILKSEMEQLNQELMTFKVKNEELLGTIEVLNSKIDSLTKRIGEMKEKVDMKNEL